MEKILLKFRESEFKSKMWKLQLAVSQVQKTVAAINAIGSFKVDKASITTLLSGNGESIAKQIEKATRAELELVGIASTSVQKAAIDGDLKTYWETFNKFSRPDNELLPYLTVNDDGRVAVAHNAEEEIRQEFSHYVKTEKGLELYQKHQQAIELLNELLRLSPLLKATNFPSIAFAAFEKNRFEAADMDYDRIVKVRP